MEKQLDQPGAARVTLENDMDYTDLIARLRINAEEAKYRRFDMMSKDVTNAADAIEALLKERDELAAYEQFGKA